MKIFPTKDKLLVADSGKITEEAFIRPVFADKKIFIIRNISNSMESAQNKLLKILEEPPKNVYFIITCSNENLVLPTIKSRCTKHELGKLSKEQIESVLKKNENSHLVSALCDGYLGKAIELERKINLKEYFESVLSLFTRLKSSRELLTYSNNVFSFKENIDQTLLIMSFIIEDMLTIKSGEKIRFVDYKNQIEMASEEFSYNALIETAKIIDRASEELFYNANPVVVFENMLLNILEVKFLCK